MRDPDEFRFREYAEGNTDESPVDLSGREGADRKPECKLVGEDGNVFSIIARVRQALRRAGREEEAQEFVKRAMSAGSYDEVLAMTFEYVEVT